MIDAVFMRKLGSDFGVLIKEQAKDCALDMKVDAEIVGKYAAARAFHLSTIINEPGFMEALKAERDNVALRAAMATVDNADKIDERLKATIHGGLAIAARAIAVLVA